MKRYSEYKSNYDKYPVVSVSESAEGLCWRGWAEIASQLRNALDALDKPVKILVVECYQGVYDQEVRTELQTRLPNAMWLDSASAMKDSSAIDDFLKDDITDDEIFGYMTRHGIDCYFDETRVAGLRRKIGEVSSGVIVLYGVGAAYVAPRHDILVYADMARWEIQLRFRRNEVSNVGVSNCMERASLQYKRGFFVDWRICDRFKKTLMRQWDYVLRTARHLVCDTFGFVGRSRCGYFYRGSDRRLETMDRFQLYCPSGVESRGAYDCVVYRSRREGV